MADIQQIPDFIEVGESGAGSLEDSPEGVRSRALTLKYLVHGFRSYDRAEERLVKLAPPIHRGHKRGRINLDPVGGEWWLGTVEYRNDSIQTRDAMRFAGWEWETSEKSEHITQFFADADDKGVVDPNRYVVVYAESPEGPQTPGVGPIPDLFGAIGVQESQVRGIEKPVAQFNWQETWICPASHVSRQRPARSVTEVIDGEPKKIDLSTEPLEKLAGDYAFRTNKYAFRGRPPGCVLLTSVRTGRMNQGSTCATLTFSFSYSPLRENFKVGPIKVVKKDGWDYLDIYYQTDIDTTELVKRPNRVYVGRVFDRCDFRDFGIPDYLPQWWLDNDKPDHYFGIKFGE